MNHAAGEQLGKLRPGDVVWVVTVLNYKLVLLGRIMVGTVTDQAGAARLLGERPHGLWEATHHIVAKPRSAQPVVAMPIQDLAGQLRFRSPGGADRLTIKRGRVNGQQLQRVRELTEPSARMIAEHWEHAWSGR